MLSADRLRVAVDATPLLGSPTGVGAFVAGLLPALATGSDVETSAFALSLRGWRDLPDRLPPGVVPLRRPMAAGVLLRAWSRADFPPVEWWTREADVVHGTNFTVPPGRRAAEVVTVHDLTPFRFPELASPASRRYPGLVRRAVERGAVVHTHSAFVAAEVIEVLGADPDRVHAVAPGIPTTGPSPAVAGAGEVDASGGRPYVLALGTVEPRKDLPTLVRAFDAVAAADARVDLVIAGAPGWGQEDLEAAVRRSRHGDRVKCLGYVDPVVRSKLLGGAAVFAFPSLYEGFGFPPLEAMAAGVPVVATRVGAVPEVLGEAACLVPPRDHVALAEALALVLTDRTVRAGLVEAGRARAAGFSWQACARGLTSLYRQAAGR